MALTLLICIWACCIVYHFELFALLPKTKKKKTLQNDPRSSPSVPQVKEFGCRSFSLLFDDIETEMCAADKQAYSTFAHAQVAITNAVYQHLGEPETFLFCPTGQAAGVAHN